MSADEFTKLFNYMEKRFTELEAKMDKRFDDTNKRIDQIMSLLDTLAKQQEIDEDERLVMRHQLDQWVHQLAAMLFRSILFVFQTHRISRLLARDKPEEPAKAIYQ